jgi:hypothetical protein
MGYYNPDWYYTAGPDVQYEPTHYQQEVYDLAKKLGNMTAEQCLAVADALIAADRYYDTDTAKDSENMGEALAYAEQKLNINLRRM